MTTTVAERRPVRLAGVGRRYGARGPWVLRGVDVELAPGRLVRATGANGTGKSTLLRLVAGVDAPAEGRITGRPARTAYVPERFPPALPFTALGYLVHLGRLQGLGGAEARARAGEWLERFGAGAYAGTALAGLSKGSAQKVAVAQALLAGPALLVLDEAWTGLDAEARAELDRAVRERVAAGAAVLFVDHDPRRLAGEADTTLRVEDGRVRAEPGAPAPAGVGAGEQAVLRPAARGVVRVVASGGLPLPDPLPGGATRAATAGGTLFRVDAAASDDLLRVLLAASWHVRRVEPGGAEGERA
ncbi:ATP-binding cassette domain-containing protein [Streptomyces sp. NPDC057854]|uniref:ATP-binding cassette domain-containing protein n=1 Tax=unclassified Streptomyces TaxID=2593676 RepID=UPI00369885B3